MTDINTLRPEDYPLHTQDKIRYSDTDRQGHVNNAVFSMFLETGRVELLYDPSNPLADVDCSFVIVKSTMNLVSELSWPGMVDIRSAIVKIGTSSITLVQGLFENGVLAATAETVIVHVNSKTHKSYPLSLKAVEVLKQYSI